MSIVEFDGPSSWSLDVSETGGEYKMPMGRGGGGYGGCPFTSTLLTHCLYPQAFWSLPSFAHRDQDGSPSSNSTINIYDLTEKQETVNSLELRGLVQICTCNFHPWVVLQIALLIELF